MTEPGRAAVIGAGSSGLVAARHFREAGFTVDIFEREDDLGGNWNYGKSAARVYRSTHTISSKPGTEYPDFPMPAEFPDYPHHSQILSYLRSYAVRFGLVPLIRFNTPVHQLSPVALGDAGTAWDLRFGGGEQRRYQAVIVANGHHTVPKYPEYPGAFTGLSLHSADYRTPDIFEGKRVLVVGGGNSGCDIAVEAAQTGVLALHSTRRGYWYMPKYLLGRPADQVGDRLLALGAPLWLRRATARLAYRLMVGDPAKTGLPRPDHQLFESHPIVNSLLPYYVRQGDIKPRPDVARLDGRTVTFVDGSSAEVDVIIWATGYQIRFPFLDQESLSWQDGRPRFYLNLFHPRYDTLFFAGLIQPDSGQFGLVHWQALLAARYARAALLGLPTAERLRRRKALGTEDLGNGIRYANSTRHYLEVEHWSYRRKLQRWARTLASDD